VAGEQFVFPVAGIIGFGPAVAVLYHALRTYDYPYTEHAYFDTRRVFLALAVGMIVGTASGWIAVALRVGASSLVSLVIILLLIVLFEEALKLVYLNRKGYRGRFDTTFIGVGLGIGIAAIAAAASAYTNGPALYQPGVFLPILAYAVSLGFVHGATAAIVGSGCAKGDVMVPFAQAVLARVLHAAMLVPFFVWSARPDVNPLVPTFSLSAAAAFAALLYRYVYLTVLPDTLPPELRRERRRRVRGQTVRK
ncbi:MAG: hypothetical protein AABY30_03775, partial [Candidatus Thermoplasmatota archaeon]